MLYRAIYIAGGEWRAMTYASPYSPRSPQAAHDLWAVMFAENFVESLREGGWRDAHCTHVLHAQRQLPLPMS